MTSAFTLQITNNAESVSCIKYVELLVTWDAMTLVWRQVSDGHDSTPKHS